jgi:hypothetical protein
LTIGFASKIARNLIAPVRRGECSSKHCVWRTETPKTEVQSQARLHMEQTVLKNREAGFGPASCRLAETFSLSGSLSSPQQPIAIGAIFIEKTQSVNATRLMLSTANIQGLLHRD